MDVLKERARIRDNNIDPQFMLLKQSLEESPKYKTTFTDTSSKRPEEIVDVIINVICESKEYMAVDALKMKQIYEKIKQV